MIGAGFLSRMATLTFFAHRMVAWFLAPGIALMRGLKLPVKLALLTTILSIPMFVLMALVVHQGHTEMLALNQKAVGVELGAQLVTVAREILIRRDLEYRQASHQIDLAGQINEAKARLAVAVHGVDDAVEKTMPFEFRDTWASAREGIHAALSDATMMSGERRFCQVSQSIDQIGLLLHQLGERSGLLYDADPESYLMIDLGLERVIPLMDELGKTRARGPVLLQQIDRDNVSVALLLSSTARLDQLLADLDERLAALARTGATLPPNWRLAHQRMRQWASHVRQVSKEPSSSGLSASDFFARASGVIDDTVLAQRDGWVLLQQRLAARQAETRSKLMVVLLALTVGFVVLAYFAASFVISFSTGLSRLHLALSAYAQGDLSKHVAISGHDELSTIGQAAESVAERLSNLVSEMRSSAMRLGQTGEAVAASACSLAERTDQQAQHLVHTSQVVSDLSSAVAANASASNELNEGTRRLSNDAEVSRQIMAETALSMHEVEAGALKMGDFVGVIDGIAFQTNILALNAAVEAARAGDCGRGFAVVAAEVRSLAQRSAGAAAEVRKLLASSQQQVDRSSRQLQEAARAIGDLVKGVLDVSTSLKTIATTSQDQSASLAEVARSIGSLDALTRQNQEVVNESTNSALELMDRAGGLASDVSAIRLRQGSADEARNLVERAMSLIQRHGLQEAMRQMHALDSGCVDRDLYVFITDRRGVYRLHCADPKKEGSRVHEVAGIDGDAFVRDSWIAANSNHWVDYAIVNPVTGVPQRKTSYVLPIENEFVLGCGFYRHEISS